MANHAPYETVAAAYLDGGAGPTSGTVVAATAGRIRALIIVGGTSAGLLTLKDGGASGDTIAEFTLATRSVLPVEMPGAGLPFGTDLYATFGVAEQAVTVMYAIE